jgi:hypothetical protein
LVDTSPVRLRPRLEDVTVPKPYPREFRDDVIAVARRGEALPHVGTWWPQILAAITTEPSSGDA